MLNVCDHLLEAGDPRALSRGCEECLKIKDTWLHLRRCLTCGHVGCCDSSKNQHASKHYRKTQHPVVQSFEPGESWRWCYTDELALE